MRSWAIRNATRWLANIQGWTKRGQSCSDSEGIGTQQIPRAAPSTAPAHSVILMSDRFRIICATFDSKFDSISFHLGLETSSVAIQDKLEDASETRGSE